MNVRSACDGVVGFIYSGSQIRRHSVVDDNKTTGELQTEQQRTIHEREATGVLPTKAE